MSLSTLASNNNRSRPGRRAPAPVAIALALALVVVVYLGVLYAGVLSRSSPQGGFDFPEEGATLADVADVRGWAIDTGASGGTGVDRVQVFLDGQPVGDADYGRAQPDVEARFGRNFGPSGWSIRFDPGGGAPGTHTLSVRVHSSVSGAETSYSRSVTLRRPSAPMGAVDLPTEGATVVGIVEVRGWAIDQKAQSASGVDEVELFIDGASVGDAAYG